MEREGIQLKRATELLTEAAGGAKQAAGICGRGLSTVYRWSDRNAPNDFISLRDLRELEANAKQPLVTMTLCRMAGGVFVPHIDLAADEGTLAGMVMQLSKELGDVAGKVSMALADGVVTPSEAEGCLRELDDMARLQAQLRTMLESIRGEN